MLRFVLCLRGASAVEFALITPLFLLMLFGIVIFGGYLTMVHGVQQLAAEAARSSVAGISDGERNTIATGYVSANASTYPLLDPGKIVVSAAPSSNSANVYVVTVTYDASGSIVFALPLAPAPSSTIVRSAAIPYGGF
ncbi:TadE/TadG family type IV pilus assembly protein [Bradyrhizobium iriomotense]|uniref:TadE/TadG family type IV pilus assembly protein n=1 Tax=Bradyrhizobium iriomotense TaxID=441950 RepID=UPI001B89F601|nr:TadE/TadG family type IV pilus assembly protein [Bradyrhizobium iriomotense]MBR0785018.1 pilus assembly protein [Bradyrhizobium iriomotense]MBR1128360.1 pilus assembly protein [Bradyrhizobium iriomotense]